MEAYGISFDDCTASISGAGEMELNVVNNLTATVSGVGGITYKGNPHVVSKVNGVGSIDKAK